MTRAELETVWAPRLLGVLRIVAAHPFHRARHAEAVRLPAAVAHGMPEISRCLVCRRPRAGRRLLLLIGLFTRPVAFILSGQMAFAYWMAHAPQSPYPVMNGGDAAILFCFLFLYLAAAGPGAFSVDGARDGS